MKTNNFGKYIYDANRFIPKKRLTPSTVETIVSLLKEDGLNSPFHRDLILSTKHEDKISPDS